MIVFRYKEINMLFAKLRWMIRGLKYFGCGVNIWLWGVWLKCLDRIIIVKMNSEEEIKYFWKSFFFFVKINYLK